MPPPDDSRAVLDTEPVIRCPAGPMRDEALRDLALEHIEVDRALAGLQRRARELELVVHAQRLEVVREILGEAHRELGRDPR